MNNNLSPNISPTDENRTNSATTPTHSQMLRFQQARLSSLPNIQVPSAEQLMQSTERPVKRVSSPTSEHGDQKRMKPSW